MQSRLWHLAPQCASNTSEMVIAVSHRVILQHELAGERGIGVEGDRRRLRELRVGEGSDGVGGGSAVLPQELEGCVPGHACVFQGVPGIHLMDVVHGHARHWCAGGNGLRQLNLHRVNAGDVVNDDADGAAVMGQGGLPLGVGEGAGKGGERVCALLETIGQGMGVLVGDRSGRVGEE